VRAQTVDELKELCNDYGLPADGTREELIDRLDIEWGSDRRPGCFMWDAPAAVKLESESDERGYEKPSGTM
jgi:hypothetical protein